MTRTQLGRVLDDHDPLSWCDPRQERREQGGLARTRATADHKRHPRPDEVAQYTRPQPVDEAGTHELIDVEHSSRGNPEGQAGARMGEGCEDGVEAGAVVEP